MLKIKPNHIVLLTPGFPKNEADSTCIPALYIFAQELSKEKNRHISVVSLYYPKSKTAYVWNNINVQPLGLSQAKLAKPINLLKVKNVLEKIHKLNFIQAIHSFWLGECAFIGHYFTKKHKIAHLTTLMGQDTCSKNLWAKLLPLPKMNLITLSPLHQNLLLKHYAATSQIIPWGTTKNTETSSNEKWIDIIGIGSLIALKNYELFISVIKEVNKKMLNLKVVIIGDGVMKQKILKLIKQNNLDAVIELKGLLPYDETQKALLGSKVLLHTSHYESFGMVFAEAIAHKVPIVSKKVGIAETNEQWYIGNNSEELAKGCYTFLSSTTSNHPLKTYPVEHTVSNYLKLYNGFYKKNN